VSVTPLEVFELADGLRRAHDQAELTRLTERVRVSAAEVRGLSAEQHRGQPCPLLQTDGSCAAYDSRPLLCRGANSFDADACARIGAAIPTYLELATAAQMAQEQLDGECLRLSGREQMLELACALLIVLEDPIAEARWRQGEPVFDTAAHAWFEGGRLRHW
jgi:Fe-S-cluster containining protein